MSARPRIGAVFEPTRSLLELPDRARRIELLGYDELWVVEDCFAYGGLTAAATALASTAHLSVGVGLLPASVRNVAIAAMELGGLAELHPLRIQAAFGHGVEAWMQQIGARPSDRLAALGEVVTAARSLLRGQVVTVDGLHVALDHVALEHAPREPPPILVGTAGPRGIALAGDLADGLLLPQGTSPAAVTWASESLRRNSRVTVYAWLRVEDDADEARGVLQPVVQAWRDDGLYPTLVARSGLPPAGEIELCEMERVGIVGTPSECAAQVMSLHRAGASSVVLTPVGEDPEVQLERFSADVLPLVLADSLLA